MGMYINNKFSIGQTVFLKTDSEQRERIVTSIVVEGNDSLVYIVYMGTESSRHYDFEMTEEVDVLKTTKG